MSYVQWIRQLIGHQKIFLVFSSVVMRDHRGHILLQRRTDFDAWGLPGGVLEIDEDIEACARRELAEETGLRATSLRLVGVYTHPQYDVTYPNGDRVQQYTICFAGRVNGGRGRADGVESSAIAFFEPGAIPSMTVPAWYRDMIRDALRERAPVFTPPWSVTSTLPQLDVVRPLVGTERLIAVGASVMTVRDDGRLLMEARPGDAGWDFPGRHCRLGENVSQTAVRAAVEIAGIEILPDRIVGICSSSRFHETLANGDRLKNVFTLFRARLPARIPEPPENAGDHAWTWMAPYEILEQSSQRARPYFHLALSHLNEGYFVS